MFSDENNVAIIGDRVVTHSLDFGHTRGKVVRSIGRSYTVKLDDSPGEWIFDLDDIKRIVK